MKVNFLGFILCRFTAQKLKGKANEMQKFLSHNRLLSALVLVF